MATRTTTTPGSATTEDVPDDVRAFEEARAAVAEQILLLVRDAEGPGSRELVAERLKGVARAHNEGDPYVLRAAIMEMALAACLWCLWIDIQHPDPAFAKMQRRTPGPGRKD